MDRLPADEQHEQLLEHIKAAGVDFVHLQFTDVPGAIKSVTIPASRLRRCLEEGVWFDGSAVEGMARVAESDLYLRPDPSTFALLPWEQRPTARLICDLCLPNGEPFEADPRHQLKSVLQEAAELGFDYRVSSEVEFFLFDPHGQETVRLSPGGGRFIPAAPRLDPIDSSSYFEVPAERAANLFYTTTLAFGGFGFEVETTHHEVAPGQHEIDVAELGALEAADAMITLKWALRAFGRRAGLLVSFMPKPIEGVSGSGLHIQQVLVDRQTRANAFFDPAGPYQLSALGGHFIAGQLAHARGMCAILAPLVNSYKRLMGGNEAPALISWARINRGALIRSPEVIAKTGTRIELRAPDPSCNPYLALAVMLKAGLDGVKQEMALPEPIEELANEAYRPRIQPTAAVGGSRDEPIADPLPEMLDEALEELDWDPVVRAALGQPIYERFLAAKEQEWVAYRRQISLWELQNYLEGA